MSKESLAALSRSETEILRFIWQMGSGTVQQVCDKLPHNRRVTYATVQTLLRRLEKKGYLTHKTKGKAHVFLPAAEREEVIKKTVGDFVDRLFGGDPLPLMLHLADHSELDTDDIKRLKKIMGKEKS